MESPQSSWNEKNTYISTSMQSITRPDQSVQVDVLKKQHAAYFPILNNPELLYQYVLEFFGPNGTEPLLTEGDIGEAESMFEWCCSNWRIHCGRNGKKAVFAEVEDDNTDISKDDLQVKLGCMLLILEDPENLLIYVASVFGPRGPQGLAITDKETWDQLDDLFMGRLPSPPELAYPKENMSEDRPKGTYRQAFNKGEFVEVVGELQEQKQQLQLSHQEPVAIPPVIEPEILDPFYSDGASPIPRMSAVEIAGWCALGAGAAVLGGLALRGLGRYLASPAGKAAVNACLAAALSSLSSPTREVFVGPRGGKYTVTANGTKSYNVP